MQNVDAVGVSEAGTPLAERDDAELLSMARLDDQEAFAALFARYKYPALRLARHLGQHDESEDVVAESFTQVLDLVRRGKGPDRAFRAYLFTTIRHEAGRRAKARKRVVPTDDEKQIDAVVQFGGGELDEFEKSAIRAAYESLPDRWRTVLWHLDVEGRKPQELGPLLDMSANSVSALVYRARSGLREAYLHQHVKDDETSERVCRAVRGKLPGFVRRAASARDQEKVHGHLEACPACMAVYLDLQEVNREVGAIVAPTSLAVSLSGAALVAGGLAAGAGGLAALCTHIAVVSKGAAMMVAPPMAAVALTTATVIGVASPDIIDPPRTPLGSFGSSTHEPDSPPADQADRVHDRTRLVSTVDRPSGTGGVDEVPMPDGVETPDGSRIPTAVAGSVEPAPAPVVKSGGGLPLPKLEPVRPVSPTVQGLTAAGGSAVGSVSSTVKDTVTVLPGIVAP